MTNNLLIVNRDIILEPGAGGIDQSFNNIPDDKYALIELFSFKFKEHANSQDQAEPIILWAYPAQKGPPRTKTVFFPLNNLSSASNICADTYSLNFRLEPGDAWGISLYRSNPATASELSVYISGYYYTHRH
ncbi:MAG: hypothetical protein P8171_01975 [Candidatus Thiodiazotropha sp.]|jgi:hypothetical protein